jgi:putative phosphoesterase
MLVGLIADVHGNPDALAAAIGPLAAVDALIFAGDLCGYYGLVDECLGIWPESTRCVRGNHDQMLLDMAADGPQGADVPAPAGSALSRNHASSGVALEAVIREWPVSLALELDGVKIEVYHGAPWDPLNGRVYPDFDDWARLECDADLVVLGHTHYQLEHRAGQTLVVNPGSVGQARDRSGAAAFAVFDTAHGGVELDRVPYDPSRVIADVARHDPDTPYLREVLVR